MNTFASLFILFFLVSCNESAFTFKVNTPPEVLETPVGPSIISISPPMNGSYYSGETIAIILNFSESVTVTGAPRLRLNINGNTRNANYSSGSGTAALLFQYAVEPDIDMDGITLQANIDLNGGRIDGTKVATGTFASENWINVLISADPAGWVGAISGSCNGGCEANMYERPEIVMIERFSSQWSISCQGVILSSKYILTTAACVDGSLKQNLRVVAGLHDRNDYTSGQIQYVEDYKIHENYDFNPGTISYANDLAIITLKRPLLIGVNVMPTTLAQPADGSFIGYPTMTYSWIRSIMGSPVANKLQYWSGNNYPVITTLDANNALSGIAGAFVWDDQIVISDIGMFGGFSRGTGSPMFVDVGGGNYVLAGILSWGVNDVVTGGVRPDYPIVGTRISSYISWITINTP